MPPRAVDGAARWAYRAAPAVPAVQLVVEATHGARHERVVDVVVGLLERLDQLGHEGRRRPPFVGLRSQIEAGILREVVAGGVGLALEQAAPHVAGGLRFGHVDAVTDRHVLGEDLDRLAGVECSVDVLFDGPLSFRVVPEGRDEVGTHERQCPRAQRRQRPGVAGQALVEVAEAIGGGQDVDDRQEAALLGETEEPGLLLRELGVGLGLAQKSLVVAITKSTARRSAPLS